MRNLASEVVTQAASHVANAVENWIIPANVLIFTVFISEGVRRLLRRAGKNQRFNFLAELSPAILALIYVLGLRIFLETAPLNPKVELWLGEIVYLCGAGIITWLIRRTAMIGIEWSAFRSHQSNTLQQGFIPLLKNLVTLFVFTIGGIMVLKHFNYDVMSLVAALGVGSLAVGLAAKDTLSNMISGFMLIIDRNLRPGDRISLGGAGGPTGDVEEIGLRSTRIRTGNGNVLIVPNADMVNTKILNLSEPSRSISCSTTLKFPLELPFGRIKQIFLATVEETGLALKDRGKWCNLAQVVDNAQVVSGGFWIADIDQEGAALSEFQEKLLIRLEREGISLKLPLALAIKA